MNEPREPDTDAPDLAVSGTTAPANAHKETSEPADVPPASEDAGTDDTKNSDPDTVREHQYTSAQTAATNGAPPRPSAEPKSGARKLVVVLALLVLLLAGVVAGAGYFAWDHLQRLQASLEQSRASGESQVQKQAALLDAQRQEIAQLRGDLAELGRSQQQMQKTVTSVRSDVNATLTEVNQTQAQMLARLDGQQNRLNSLSTTSREDWLLAEAEYLLRLANQRVLLERRPDNAIALLSAADEIVKQVAAGMGDPELFAIRKALGRELTELKLMPVLDQQGTFVQLEALADAVARLPRVPQHRLQTPTEEPAFEFEATQDRPWYAKVWQTLKESAGVLDQYIRIESTDTPGQPLLSQHEALLVSANVRLLLAQAQLALLRAEPTIYRESIERASQRVSEHFMPSPERTNYLNQLNALLEQQIDPQMPDISGSLALLHGFVEKLHKLED